MSLRKIVILLACVIGWAGCTSSVSQGTYYDVLIDAYGTKPNSKGETFVVLPGTQAFEGDQLRFDSVAQVLDRALISQGLAQAKDANNAQLQIALFFDLRKESDQDDFQIPTYTKGIPGSLTPGRTIHTGLERALIPALRTMFIRYVVVTAIDRGSHKIIWETTIMSRGESDELAHVAAILVASARGDYGRSLTNRKSKTVWDSDSEIRSLVGP